MELRYLSRRACYALLLAGLFAGMGPQTLARAQTQTKAEALYAELEKLSPDQRLKRLEEGARAEGQLRLIHSWNRELAEKHMALFKARYPFLKVSMVILGSQDATERLLAEATAGRHLTDVVTIEVADIPAVASHVARYDTPVISALLPQFQMMADKDKRYVPFYWTEQGISYNTNLLKAEDAPKTWDDLCKPAYKGLVSYDPPKVRFLVGLYSFMGEERLVKWLECVGKNQPIIQRGMAQRMNLMLAGDHAIQGDNYLYYGMKLRESNKAPFAPVWSAEIFASPGVGIINKNTPYPHAAALFSDWLLSPESQRLTRDEYRGSLTLDHPYLPKDAKMVFVPIVEKEVITRLLGHWDRLVTRAK